MKKITLFLSISFILTGCASLSVNSNFDRELDYSALKTYHWLKSTQEPISEPILRNTLSDAYIARTINERLKAEGLSEQADGQPDFLVDYHIDVRRTEEIVRKGAWHHDWPNERGNITTIYESRKGTFVLDFLDPESKNLIWRGWATGVIEQNPDPEKIKKKFEKAVEKIFEKFPPSTGTT